MSGITLQGAMAPLVQQVCGKGDWQLYRPIIAVDADSTSNMARPTSILSTTDPVNVAAITTIYLRARFTNLAGTLTYKIVGWGRNDSTTAPGQVLATGTLTAGSERDASGGKYISPVIGYTNVCWCRYVQVFVTAVSNVDVSNQALLDVVGV